MRPSERCEGVQMSVTPAPLVKSQGVRLTRPYDVARTDSKTSDAALAPNHLETKRLNRFKPFCDSLRLGGTASEFYLPGEADGGLLAPSYKCKAHVSVPNIEFTFSF